MGIKEIIVIKKNQGPAVVNCIVVMFSLYSKKNN